MRKLNGAYSLAVITPDALMMARDPMGIRPLCLGQLDGGWVVASETCALDHLGATFIREVEPGEVIYIDAEGLQSCKPLEEQSHAFCVFEYIYFARPDSVLDGKLLYPVRMNLGRAAREGAPGRRRHRDRRAGLGDGGGDRLLAGVGHPVRRGAGEEPLRRPHVHPAGPAAARESACS